MVYDKLMHVIENSYDDTVQIRRHLHRNPELSFQEENTKKLIEEELRKYGYSDIRTNVGGGGILAILDTGKPGPVIGLRADFDGLAVQEEAEVEFRSTTPGVMHACGHDVHTSGLLSVAKAAKQYEAELVGKLVFIFQHAEELPPGGAKAIVESGELDDLDYIYGLHVHGNVKYTGNIGYHSGYAMAASDSFEIEIKGKGGHAASPHTSIDPTVTAAFLIQQLQTIISRKKDPTEPAVLTIAIFKSGEGAHNVIADKAYIKGTVRTFNPQVQNEIEAEIIKMSQLVCEAHGATATVDYRRGYPAVFNHEKQTALVKDLFTENFGEDSAQDTPPSMGGEDFAYYLQKIPGTFFFVPAGIPEQEINYPHHHGKFTVDERSLLIGAKTFALIIDYYLKAPVNQLAGENV